MKLARISLYGQTLNSIIRRWKGYVPDEKLPTFFYTGARSYDITDKYQIQAAKFYEKQTLEMNNTPTADVFFKMIYGFIKANESEKVSLWTKKLLSSNVPMDIEMINELLLEFHRIEDYASIEFWIRQLENGYEIPNKKSYGIIISYYGNLQNIDKIKYWLGQLTASPISYSMDLPMYSMIISALGKAGDRILLDKWVDKFSESKFTPCSMMYCSLFGAFLRTRNLDSLKLWAHSMPDSLLTEQVFGILLSAFTSLQDATSVKELIDRFDSMRGHRISRISILSKIILSFSDLEDFHSVTYWIKRLESSNIPINCKDYTRIINMFTDIGDHKNAIMWCDKLENSGVQIDSIAYSAIINDLGKLGDLQSAIKWTNKLESSSIRMSESLYRCLIRTFGLSLCDSSNLTKWVKKFEASGIQINQYALRNIIQSFEAAGDRENALVWKAKSEQAEIKAAE